MGKKLTVAENWIEIRILIFFFKGAMLFKVETKSVLIPLPVEFWLKY